MDVQKPTMPTSREMTVVVLIAKEHQQQFHFMMIPRNRRELDSLRLPPYMYNNNKIVLLGRGLKVESLSLTHLFPPRAKGPHNYVTATAHQCIGSHERLHFHHFIPNSKATFKDYCHQIFLLTMSLHTESHNCNKYAVVFTQ